MFWEWKTKRERERERGGRGRGRARERGGKSEREGRRKYKIYLCILLVARQNGREREWEGKEGDRREEGKLRGRKEI